MGDHREHSCDARSGSRFEGRVFPSGKADAIGQACMDLERLHLAARRNGAIHTHIYIYIYTYMHIYSIHI